MTTPESQTTLSPQRQAIVDAATKLIVKQGVENTSLADIAREVGISKGTLYYHYASKSDLIFEVTEQHFDRVTQGLLEWIDTVKGASNPDEIFRVVFETILQAEMRGRLHIYLIQSITMGDSDLRERYQEKYRQWQQMIEIGLNIILGERPEHHTLAALLLAALDGFVIQSHLGVEPIPVGAITQWLVDKI